MAEWWYATADWVEPPKHYIPARARLATDPIGISAPKPGSLDRLMRINGQPVLGSALNHMMVMIHHGLPVMIFIAGNALIIDALNIAAIGDIAGFHSAVAEPFI